MKVITFSRVFPAHHPRAGESTYFAEKIFESLYRTHNFNDLDQYESKYRCDLKLENVHTFPPKNHTIRAGQNWNVGEFFSPRVWGDDINPKSKRRGPYHSKQVHIYGGVEIKKIYDFKITPTLYYLDNRSFDPRMPGARVLLNKIAENDGLGMYDLINWFKVHPKRADWGFEGQILCWGDVNYG